MTLSEFKAWFEGFTEIMDGPPSAKQWERIQARVKEITGMPITERVYVDRYYRDLYRPYWSQPMYAASGVANTGLLAMNAGKAAVNDRPFNGETAMLHAGRTEAREMV